MPKPTLMYVRVKCPSTGHEYDVREDSPLLRNEVVKRIKDKAYPPSRVPRRPKHHIDLAGLPVARETGTDLPESEPPTEFAVADEDTEEGELT